MSTKGAMAEVLHEDYMSSEESECETSPSRSIRFYKVKKLNWENDKLKKRKAKLDKLYKKNFHTERTSKRIYKRVNEGISDRQCSENCPQLLAI